MKFRASWASALSLAVVLLAAPARGVAWQKADEALTNASVVKLVRAGFSEKTVIAIIVRRPSRFDLSPDALIGLKKGGVSERIIVAMISRQDAEFFADSEMDDDGFFGGGRAGESARGAGQGKPGELDIFGSSGGSKGRVKSRGDGGEVESDTQTGGSVSARILRPPRESGGAGAPKLERTPTLTNESVIQLVEGGFTDGTIIRRIEQSPVEFDLSPQKLDELRRRRVSESVITAMRAAMQGATGEGGRPGR
jgi:hypothetical protein